MYQFDRVRYGLPDHWSVAGVGKGFLKQTFKFNPATSASLEVKVI